MGFEDIGALHLGQNRELCCVRVGVVAWPNGHPLLLHHNFFGLSHQKEYHGVRVNGGGGEGGLFSCRLCTGIHKIGAENFT